jgi:demethylspheroidene O-methyltransferase
LPPELTEAARPGWRDRLAAWHDRLMADGRFRQWAARFPLTRPVARRRARALFDLTAGFVYSQVLLACVELDVFTILAEGPLEERALAHRLGLPRDAAAQLLEAAEALGLTRRRRGRWALGRLGAVMVGNAALEAMIRHHAMLYRDLADPVALLRGERGGGALAAYWPYAGAGAADRLSESQTAPYTRLMAASQPMIAAEVLAAHDFRAHRRLLDIGGGDGTFLRQVGAAHPDLQLMLFDLPSVVEQAHPRFAEAGMAQRARLHGGDFHAMDLPRGADAASFVRVLHDHDDDAVRRMLAAAHAALSQGGTLIVAEPMAGAPGAEAMGAAYFGLYLRAMGSGRPRHPSQLQALLEDAGFRDAQLKPTPTPLVTQLIVCRK